MRVACNICLVAAVTYSQKLSPLKLPWSLAPCVGCKYSKPYVVFCVAGMLFGWETIMTFVLVSVVYAVAVGEPSFGNIGPYAVGLSLFAMVFAGKNC